MSGYWSVTNHAAAAAAATATQATPASGAPTTIRVRSVQCSIGGTTAASGLAQILDGATVVWQTDVTNNAPVVMSGMDIRITPGNSMTIAFSASVANANDVNAQGDYVPQGYPMFQN